MRSELLATSLLAVLVVACSSSSSSGDSCGAFFDSTTAYTQACSSSSSGKTKDKARFLQTCQLSLAAPGTSLTPAAVDACAAAYRSAAASCTSADVEKACSTAPGALADGAACGGSEQCASTYCKKESSSSSTTETGCGKCAATVALGAACDAAKDRCVRGSSCKTTGTSTTGTCTASTSATKVPEGGACVSETGSFSSCDAGLRCDFPTKKCAKLVASGEACLATSDCQKGLACVGNRCGAKVAVGGTCATSSDCVNGAACDATKKCAAYTFGAPGDACDLGTKQCAKGSCTGVTVGTSGVTPGKCPTIIADGQPCDTKSETARCDEYASCIGGKCQIFDPSTCK